MARVIAKAAAVTALGFVLLATVSAAAAHDGSLLDFVVVRMKRSAQLRDTPFRLETASRQATQFAAFLQDTNPVAFRRMMTAILGGRPFAEAVQTSYGADVNALWERFVQGLKER